LPDSFGDIATAILKVLDDIMREKRARKKKIDDFEAFPDVRVLKPFLNLRLKEKLPRTFSKLRRF